MAFRENFANKFRLEWAECGKLITKRKLKGALEKEHSIIKDGKIGKTIMCQAQG